MSAGHAHDRAGRRHRRPLAIALVLVAVVMVAEFVAGALTGSLALISDAGHMATDALGLGMALAAIVVADRVTAATGRTYGLYRLEILAALANAVLLFGVAGYVMYEAVDRLREPSEVASIPMLVVAVVGLVVNLIGWRLLRRGAEESLNLRGAYLEVLADLAGSVGVIVAAVVIQLTGWTVVDAVVAVLIGVFILPRAWQLGKLALRILVQAAPDGLDVDELESDLLAIDGVVDVHDLHVWTLTSDMDVATAHLVTSEATDHHGVLDRARSLLESSYRIGHATLQVEPDTHEGCAEVTW